MGRKIAQTIESIMKKQVDPISVKWYDDDDERNNQDHKNLDLQEMPRADTITTSTVHNANNVTRTE